MNAVRSLLPTVALLLTMAALAASGCTKKQPPAAPPIQDNKLVIVKAVWGDSRGEAAADVTQLVAGMVKDNALSVPANKRLLGDPAEGKIKYLWVKWSKGGVVARKRADEGKTLEIRRDERPVPMRLVVRKSIYGDLAAGKTEDVTAIVAGLVEDNVLSLTPSNALFGDPFKGQAKQLRVDYTFDGVAKSRIADEKHPLLISESAP
jgi:hypothetical protein